MTLDKLNSQESLERLASYILKAANQDEIINDEATVTDSCWSSNKVQEELDDAKTQADEDYVAVNQGTSQSGRYLIVDDDGKTKALVMAFETTNIDFNNDWS